ncbi:mesoderm posterior homolog B [Xenopus tropicalis]|uniref:Mesoderm posterior homolog B n=1 Tax=Xenopus tropicalis TaxID=8364 RepID=Q28IK9_XENTR|nr:mesoderm posterior homolog B [Xenopus tropicalis]CAJ82769.1 novel protein similar to Mespo-MesP-related bHLH factor [Xenopus tropicalis]|eukprot:NP_001016653.1 mesoderm posterior homolog B [Xenopus tropicalis]
MDSFSVAHHQQDCTLNQHCATLYPCGYPSSEGYSSLSPASSSDSSGQSPPYMPYIASQEIFVNIPAAYGQAACQRRGLRHDADKRGKKNTGKLPYSQRQSASEREKLRMRNLSKALQNLRRYLPPSVAPLDKTLTKIETLQLTISYISHLSAQLGLTEEILTQRRLAETQRTNLCPSGFSCCMDPTHRLCTTPEEDHFNPAATPTMPFSEARCYPEPGYHGREAVCQQSCETPLQLKQEITSPQYADPSTMAKPVRQQCITGLQHTIHCEDYYNLADIWRRDQLQAQMDQTF